MQNPTSPPPCPLCAATPANTAPCFVCGHIAAERRAPRALQLAAVDGLALDLGRRPHLPDDLRRDLLGRLDKAREALRPVARAVAAPVARVVAPARPTVPAPDRIAAARVAARPAPAPTPATAPTQTPAPPRPILPDWLSRLGPAAAENLMYLLGGFLVVAGAVYFASTAWTTMSGVQRLLLLDGGLLALGALLIGVGRLLTRGFAGEPAGVRIRGITAHIAAGLGPLACIIGGRAAMESPLAGLGALAIVSLGVLGARRLADGRAASRSTLATLGVSWAAAAAPLVGASPIGAALAGGALTGLIARFGLGAPRGAELCHLVGAAFALAAHLILCTDAFAAGTVTLAALAAGLVGHVTGRAGRLPVLALALMAIGPAFTLPDLLPAVGLLATWTAARVALALDRAPLLGIPLATSLLAYVTTPAPLRELVQAAKAAFSASMGYGSEPLPLAWYGLTCLPYVLGLAWVAHRLRGRPPMARMATGWLLLVTLGLCGLSVVSHDPRAPMAVLAADGLALLLIGLGLRRRVFVVLAPLALMGSGIAAAVWLGLTPAAALLLTEVAVGLMLLAALPFARRRDLHRPLLWTAGVPLLAAAIALVPISTTWPILVALALLLPGVILRARHTGNPGWVVAAGALAVGLLPTGSALLGLPAGLIVPAAAALLLGVAEASRLGRRRPRRAAGPRLVLPVGMTAALVWLAFAQQAAPTPLAGFAVGLLWTHAGWRLRVAPAATAAVLAFAATAGWSTALHAPDPELWAPLAVGGVGLLAVLAARHTTPWLRRLRSGLVEAGAVALLAGPVLAALFMPSGDATGLLSALTLLLAGSALVPETRLKAPLQLCGLLTPLAAAAALDSLYGMLVAPIAYALMAALRLLGRPLLPTVDRAAAGLLLAVAGALGGALALDGLLHDPAPTCAGLALLVALCATAVGRHPRAGSAVTIGLGLLLLWGPLPALAWRALPDWLPLIWPATGLLLVLGAHRIGLHRGTARVYAAIIAIALGLAQLPWLVMGVAGIAHPLPLALDAPTMTAFAALWGGLVLATLPGALRRPAAGVVAIPLAVLWPVASGLLQPGAAPALELAALSLLVGGRSISLVLATLALVAAGDPRSPLFALTLTAMIALPLRAVGRHDRAFAVELTVYAVFAAAVGWLIALVPSSGSGPIEILPVVGLIAASMGLLVEEFGPRALARSLDPDRIRYVRRPLLALSAIAAVSLVVNIGLMGAAHARTAVVVSGLLAGALLCVTAVRHARRSSRRAAVDGALLAVALTHLFVALRSPWLAPLDGLHLLLWAAAAPCLRFVGGVGELTVRLRSRALLLPLPALIVTLPDNGDSAIACLLAAITWGLAARQSGRAVFTGLGLGLLLAAACRIGLSMDVVDPAFYGLPAGLMLIVGAWLERQTLSQRAVEGLQVAGVVIADLSVAVQVLRLDQPAHAVLLFALGLASVAVGWRRKRGDLMLVGAIAVVVDVTLHLLRTGFARGFLAAALLVGAGAVVLLVAGHHTRRRART